MNDLNSVLIEGLMKNITFNGDGQNVRALLTIMSERNNNCGKTFTSFQVHVFGTLASVMCKEFIINARPFCKVRVVGRLDTMNGEAYIVADHIEYRNGGSALDSIVKEDSGEDA